MRKIARAQESHLTRELAVLPKLTIAELKGRWRLLYGHEPPRRISRELLMRAVAYRLQERVFGGLKPATRRMLERLGADLAADRPMRMAPLRKRGLGTVLIREWRGTHQETEGWGRNKNINLIKSIEKIAEENSGDPFLVAMAERAKAVQEDFEDRQTTTAEALTELLKEIEKDERRKKEQSAKGLDGLTYFVLCKLTDDGIPNPATASEKVAAAFAKFLGAKGVAANRAVTPLNPAEKASAEPARLRAH